MEEQHSPLTEEDISTPSEVYLSDQAIGYLLETSKWGKVLSIFGFISVGLMLVVSLFSGYIMGAIALGQENSFPNSMRFVLSGVYLLAGLFYFIPSWYLFKFSQKIKLALSVRNDSTLTTAFGYLKSLYKFCGIFLVVTLSVYALGLLFAVIGALFFGKHL